MQRDQGHALALLVVGVDVRDQRHLGEEILEALGGVAVVEVLGQAAQLVQVLQPRLALRSPVLVIELEVHDLDHMVDELAGSQDAEHGAQRLELRAETLQRRDRGPRQAGDARGVGEQGEDVGL